MRNPPARFKDVCVDATDHQRIADWWCAAIGYVRAHPTEGSQARPRDWPVLLVDPDGAGPAVWLNPVPEPKTVKNRMHLDVVGDTTALLAAGATLLRRRGGDVDWDVLADPEGNEFCCFSDQP
jgi:Glyoxalase-like domain